MWLRGVELVSDNLWWLSWLWWRCHLCICMLSVLVHFIKFVKQNPLSYIDFLRRFLGNIMQVCKVLFLHSKKKTTLKNWMKTYLAETLRVTKIAKIHYAIAVVWERFCRLIFFFQICSSDGQTEIGNISKQWAGAVKECFTKISNYGMQCKYWKWQGQAKVKY